MTIPCPRDPGSASVLDAKIDFTFSSPGTYVIAVGEFFSEDAGGSVQGNSPDPGESYTLHVSVENHPIDPGTPIPQDDRDFYRFDAVQGDVITLAATAVSGSADSMSLQLLNSSGTVLATGSSGAENVDRYVQDYEIPALATYFVRVGSTNDDVDYSLVITRDATFDLGLPGAQNIDATDTVLGHVGESLAPIEVIEFDELPEQPLDGVSVKGATFDFKVGGADSDAATFGSIGIGVTAFITAPFASGNPAGIVTIDFDTPTPIFGFAAALLTLAPVVTPGVTVTLLDEASTVIDTIDVTLFNEGFLFISEAIFSYTGTPVSSAVLDFNEAVAFEFGLDNVTFQGEQVVDADQYEIVSRGGGCDSTVHADARRRPLRVRQQY